MKLATEEQFKAHNAASIRGAAEGAAFGGLIAGGGAYYLNRRWAAYRSLPISLKALGIVIVIGPCLSIQAERRGLQYDQSQWTGVGKMTLDEEATEAEVEWEHLTAKQKIAKWADSHQYSLILGSWASSLAIAGAIISRDRYQSLPQKVVQARMWAQGLTIGVLIVAGALTSSKRAEAAKHLNTDHSWAVVLAQQEKEKQAEEEEQKHKAASPAPA